MGRRWVRQGLVGLIPAGARRILGLHIEAARLAEGPLAGDLDAREILPEWGTWAVAFSAEFGRVGGAAVLVVFTKRATLAHQNCPCSRLAAYSGLDVVGPRPRRPRRRRPRPRALRNPGGPRVQGGVGVVLPWSHFILVVLGLARALAEGAGALRPQRVRGRGVSAGARGVLGGRDVPLGDEYLVPLVPTVSHTVRRRCRPVGLRLAPQGQGRAVLPWARLQVQRLRRLARHAYHPIQDRHPRSIPGPLGGRARGLRPARAGQGAVLGAPGVAFVGGGGAGRSLAGPGGAGLTAGCGGAGGRSHSGNEEE
mmetsp:Transcript_104213/g.238622  ORF Transcript_104213/g.238622 Transcript_104213/m.238622 type:complete len:310 (+) Transcript_104213:226-1155(+)